MLQSVLLAVPVWHTWEGLVVLAQHDGLGKLMAKLCFYVNCGNGNAVWRASLVRGISLYTAVCLRTTQYWWEHRFR